MDYKHREALRLVDGCLSDEKIAGMTGIPPEDVQALRALLRAPPPLPAPHPGAERGMNKPKRRQKGDSK
jgi:hypothetical protein